MDPEYASAYNSRCLAYIHVGFNDKALSDCSRLIQLKPDFTSHIKHRLAYLYDQRGIAYKEQHVYGQALRSFNKAIEVEPDDARAYFNRGLILFGAKYYDKGWIDINKAQSLGLKIDPEDLAKLKKISAKVE